MSLSGDVFDLRLFPRPKRRKILRLRLPSGRRGMGLGAREVVSYVTRRGREYMEEKLGLDLGEPSR